MKHIRPVNSEKVARETVGCRECPTSCQSACKTSCTVGNQVCVQMEKVKPNNRGEVKI